MLAGSAGALPVILAQLNRLTSRSDAALFVIYHRLPNADFRLASFATSCTSRIREAVDGERVEANVVYHSHEANDLEVVDGRLVDTTCEARNHPNIDRLLASLAANYGPRVTAVLLSGMGQDGLRGLEAIRAAGGQVAVQSPGTSRFPQLPTAAIEAGFGSTVLPLPDLHAYIDAALGIGDQVLA